MTTNHEIATMLHGEAEGAARREWTTALRSLEVLARDLRGAINAVYETGQQRADVIVARADDIEYAYDLAKAAFNSYQQYMPMPTCAVTVWPPIGG